MKTNKIFFIVALLAVSMLSACNFLNSENKSTVTADEQFSTESGWNQLLVQAYYQLRPVFNNPVMYCAGTDLYTTSQGNAPTVLHTYQYTADEPQVESLYKSLYAAINSANCVLKYSSNDALNDEAKFIRCLGYYILTQQFGEIPYITKYIESAESSYPRTALADIYTGVINELEEVMNAGRLAPLPSNCAGHANLLACKALLAKVYLAAAWDLDTKLTNAEAGTYSVIATERFDKAAKLADDVASKVTLIPDFEQKWDYSFNEAGNNVENLFAVQYDRATAPDQVKGGHSQQHYFGGYMGSQSLGVKALTNTLCPTERVYLSFEPGDDRFEGTFMTTIYASEGKEENWFDQGYWAYWNASLDKSKLPIAWKFFPWYADDAEVNTYLANNADRFVTVGMKQPTKVIRVGANVDSWGYKADGTVDAATTKTQTFGNAMATIGYLPPVKKFDDGKTPIAVGQSSGDYRDFIVLDASEICLSGAEAYLLANKPGKAVDLLNKVRERSHASSLSSLDAYTRYDAVAGTYIGVGSTDGYGVVINLLDVILDERMRETLGQQYRWMDLKRTKQLVRYNIAYNEVTEANMTGVDGKIKWLRPIPTNEMQINTGITEQNPGFGSVAK